MKTSERENFENEYRNWIRLMSRDAAYRLCALQSNDRESMLKTYEKFRNPNTVFRSLSESERILSLAGERIKNFIVIETEAITFFPSIFSRVPGIQDFAVVMNRRFYCQKLWFPIISLNSAYIENSSDKSLAFSLEHEFEMNRLYQEIALQLRPLATNEKQEIMHTAMETSVERQKITQEELIEDERLMLRLSRICPLLPKPYAEMAMLLYLQVNLSNLFSFGEESRSPEEEAFGEQLYEEFQSWSEFSQKTYELFLREIKSNLCDTDLGYS